MKVLEIGGGEHPNPEATVRVDIRKLNCVDVVADAEDLHMFSDCSFDKVYARHVLEHWSFRDTKAVLREWHRVIRVNGILEVHVPDLDKLIQNYVNKKLDCYTGKAFDIFAFSYYIYGGQEYKDNTHKAGWNFEALSKILVDVGFHNIIRDTKHEDCIEMRIYSTK